MTQDETRCRVVSQVGTVTRVSGAYADIQILQTGACASCTVKGVCNPGDSSVKLIHARLLGGAVPGDRVLLEMDARNGMLGVLVSYVVPLVLVVAVLFGVRPHVERESWAGLLAIASLVPYFGLIYLARGIFARVIEFRATPLEKEGAL